MDKSKCWIVHPSQNEFIGTSVLINYGNTDLRQNISQNRLRKEK